MQKNYDICIGRMESKHHSPTEQLKPYIETYILYKNINTLTNTQLNLVANGKIIFYVFYNGNYAVTINTGNQSKRNNFILGLSTLRSPTPITIKADNNPFGCIATSFTYRGIVQLLGVLPCELTDKSIEIEFLLGSKGKQLVKEIINSVSDAKKIKTLNQFFTRQIKTDMNYKQKSMGRVLDLIHNSSYTLSVHRLSKNAHMSYRTIHRLFQNQIGMSPKNYLNIIRFNRLCSQLKMSSITNWNDIIFKCGYYDQAHFINEFRQIMHAPPKQFVNMCKGNFYLERAVFLGEKN